MSARPSLPSGMRRRLVSLCLAAAVAACGTNVAASPTPAPAPLAQAELKYRVMDAGGRIEFCDPDFYPIARVGGTNDSHPSPVRDTLKARPLSARL